MADLASQPTDLADDAIDPSVSAELPPPAGNDDLLGELARAMHAAATSQYERLNAELERRRTEQVEGISARASSDTENLKASTESDIGAIDAWSKTEMEKIKQERLRRIDSRREQLAAQLERQETIKQREVFAIEVAIDTHRSEVDQFFGRMERETDPTAIARVASSLPPFPSLTEVAEEARRGAAAEFASLDAGVGSLPTSEATVAADTEATAVDTAAIAAPAAAAAADTETAPDGASVPTLDEAPGDGIVSETRLRAVMDPDASLGGSHEGAPPWEAPYAVSVTAGSGTSEPAAEPEPHGRVGSTLLRTVRAIRPMAGSDKDDTAR